MRKTILSLAAVLAIGTTMAVAGGDLAPVAPVEIEVVEVPWTGLFAGAGFQMDQTYLVGEADWFGTSNLNKTNYGIMGDVGYTFYNNGTFAMSAEGRLGTSLFGDDYVETTNWGVYAKPEVIFNAFSVYALGGYGGVDMTDTENAELVNGKTVQYSVTASETGFTYGFGIGYALNESLSVFADYTVLPSFDLVEYAGASSIVKLDESIENDVVSVGINYRF